MPISLEEFQEALDGCASEPVHIPGHIQPFACVLAADMRTRDIQYVSENSVAFLGHTPSELLGENFTQRFGSEIWHAIANAAAGTDSAKHITFVGRFELHGKNLDISVYQSGDCFVLEIENTQENSSLSSAHALKMLSFLTKQLHSRDTPKELITVAARLMQFLTEYDRVVIYNFDPDFNSEIIAESTERDMEPLLGLRFPSDDIPPQVRDIMSRVPMRMIGDIAKPMSPMLAISKQSQPLDMTLGYARGVSPVHVQYIENMGLRATLALSIMVNGTLWGVISFNHRTPKVPERTIRDLLLNFLEVLNLKLETLINKERLKLIAHVDTFTEKVLTDLDDDKSMQEALPEVAKTVLNVMSARGFAWVTSEKSTTFGQTPNPQLFEVLSDSFDPNFDKIQTFECLRDSFPTFADELNGCAGAIVVSVKPGLMICIFRETVTQSISWAGNPEKQIDLQSGIKRLAPRASFSIYLEEKRNHCAPWKNEDLQTAKQIWSMLNAAERRVLMNTLNRQQNLMIHELNHRVRNILSLVKSVSRQARRHNDPQATDTESLEARIQALATAHDLASASVSSALNIKDMIASELKPFNLGSQYNLSGDDHFIRAKIVPIFSLIIHELATNATKHGALSCDAGYIEISLSSSHDGLKVIWQERNGPLVEDPKYMGFGSILIEEAVPYELGGTANLTFDSAGVRAEITLPSEALSAPNIIQTSADRAVFEVEHDQLDEPPRLHLPSTLSVLILEDSFIIAQDLCDLVSDFGIQDVKRTSNTFSAHKYLDETTPDLAILDINLGDNETSEPIALRLAELDIPFFFITGYGNTANLPYALNHIQRLTKPVTPQQLHSSIANHIRPDNHL